MIDSFPKFTKLQFDHKKEIETITSKFPPYSDFNFTSLFCWNVDSDTELSLLNENLVIKLADYISGEPVYSILGDNNINKDIADVLNKVNELKLVPSSVIENLSSPEMFKIVEDRDNFDYIYKSTDLINLAGGHLKKKRNKVNGFKKDHLNRISIEHTHTITKRVVNELRGVAVDWSELSGREISATKMELEAINNILEYFNELNLMLTHIKLDGHTVAFSIHEVMNNGYAICHFEKATSQDNIYAFMAQEIASMLLSNGCEYINWEQDLGIVGLRQSKVSYQPVAFLKKYNLSLAS